METPVNVPCKGLWEICGENKWPSVWMNNPHQWALGDGGQAHSKTIRSVQRAMSALAKWEWRQTCPRLCHAGCG